MLAYTAWYLNTVALLEQELEPRPLDDEDPWRLQDDLAL